MGSGFSTLILLGQLQGDLVTIPLGGEWILYGSILRNSREDRSNNPLGWGVDSLLLVDARILILPSNNPLGWGVDSLPYESAWKTTGPS